MISSIINTSFYSPVLIESESRKKLGILFSILKVTTRDKNNNSQNWNSTVCNQALSSFASAHSVIPHKQSMR